MEYRIYKNEDFDPKTGINEFGKVVDEEIGKTVLFAFYDPASFEKGGYHCAMFEADGICIVEFDDIYLDHFKRPYVFAGAVMHELGHLINGDSEKLRRNPDISEKRKRIWYIENGMVDPKEIKADNFAADQLGTSMVINALKYMREARIKNGREGTDLAVKEFDARIRLLRQRRATEKNLKRKVRENV